MENVQHYIGGSYSRLAEDLCLGCDTVLLREWLPTFGGLLDLEMKPLRSFETPAATHPKTQYHACVPLNPTYYLEWAMDSSFQILSSS